MLRNSGRAGGEFRPPLSGSLFSESDPLAGGGGCLWEVSVWKPLGSVCPETERSKNKVRIQYVWHVLSGRLAKGFPGRAGPGRPLANLPVLSAGVLPRRCCATNPSLPLPCSCAGGLLEQWGPGIITSTSPPAERTAYLHTGSHPARRM